jgi:ATP/maltotriose-dependent transcriptional regulator MalT
VSLNTVKSHVKSLFRKLDASSREQAGERARELTLA